MVLIKRIEAEILDIERFVNNFLSNYSEEEIYDIKFLQTSKSTITAFIIYSDGEEEEEDSDNEYKLDRDRYIPFGGW